MKHVFIIKYGNKEQINRLAHELKLYGEAVRKNFVIYAPENDKEMKKIVALYKYDIAAIYAVGDDAWMNLILNELVGGRAFLGLIPVGKKNDFYQTLSENDSNDSKLVQNCNIMNINGRYGLNVFSVGIEAEMFAYAKKLRKLKIPTPNIISLLRSILTHKTTQLTITNENEEQYNEASLLAICNGSYSNGLNLAPDASPLKPEVEICIGSDISKMELPLALYKLSNGEHITDDHFSIDSSSNRVIIQSNDKLTAQLDGRIIRGKEFEVEPSAAKIPVVCDNDLIDAISPKR